MGWAEIWCEQLVIGTTLAERTPPAEAAHLHAGDFEHPIAGRLYTDILRVQAAHPGWAAAQVAADCASRFAHGGITANLLEELAATAGNTDQAEIAIAYEEVVRSGSETAISRELRQLGRPGGEESRVRRDAYARLGLALNRRAEILRLRPDRNDDLTLLLFEAWSERRPDTRRPAEPTRDRVRAEESLLAGLLQYPDIAWVVTGWLPDRVFTTEFRRDIYQALSEDFLPTPTSRTLGHVYAALREVHDGGCQHDTPIAQERTLIQRYLTYPVTCDAAVRAAREIYAADLERASGRAVDEGSR
ncbi:hypothetical protein BDK92_2691 [Micromonospora pisi]|uniref:Uncharacterized protein n=1 Tax=Micromonospora pisi TaxID=589240 RepID=A0A495JJ08_9ACTN|nr:hypothetical protein [Micromonospora pisi]RKR88374.1 hypothetical protein BDK92_2691 [Micromonospora pisi]